MESVQEYSVCPNRKVYISEFNGDQLLVNVSLLIDADYIRTKYPEAYSILEGYQSKIREYRHRQLVIPPNLSSRLKVLVPGLKKKFDLFLRLECDNVRWSIFSKSPGEFLIEWSIFYRKRVEGNSVECNISDIVGLVKWLLRRK